MRIRKNISLLGASVLLALSQQASAAPIVLTFEGLGDQNFVNDFYNGGTDSAGHTGINYGISFANAVAGIDADAGGTGNFANEPSPSTAIGFLSGTAATMNVAAGFSGGFSFYYTSPNAGFINVYDGLNSTGNLLATLVLTPTFGSSNPCTGDPGGNYCAFAPIGVQFAGIARSVDFGGGTNDIGFDNITLGTDVPGNPVPEPGTLALFTLAGMGLAFGRKSKAR